MSKINSKKSSKKTSSKSLTKSLNLYTDDNPKTTIHGTGFANKEAALKTLELIKHRSLGYQFALVNTLYNRARYHPYVTKDMHEAMKVFINFLHKNKKEKKDQDKLYPFVSLDIIKSYEKLAQKYRVSEVARGVKPSIKTDMGFLKMLKHVSHPNKLQFIPIKKSNPQGEDYWSYRINFIKSRLAQMKSTDTPLFYTEGKYSGFPTKQHIILIMHGYSPLGKKLKTFYNDTAYL
jgi:hypothetical protein